MISQVLFKRTGITKSSTAICSSSIAFFPRTPCAPKTKWYHLLRSLNRSLELKRKRILWPQTNALFTVEQHVQYRSFIWSNQEANKVHVPSNSHFTVTVTYHSNKLRNQKRDKKPLLQQQTSTVDRSASDHPPCKISLKLHYWSVILIKKKLQQAILTLLSKHSSQPNNSFSSKNQV